MPAWLRWWLPVNANRRTRNVASEAGRPWSLLELYRSLLHVRREHPALHAGDLRLRTDTAPDLLVYDRRAGDDHVVVAANLGATAATLTLPGPMAVLAATAEDVVVEDGVAEDVAAPSTRVLLPPDRAVVLGRPADRSPG